MLYNKENKNLLFYNYYSSKYLRYLPLFYKRDIPISILSINNKHRTCYYDHILNHHISLLNLEKNHISTINKFEHKHVQQRNDFSERI